jgi:hypothetical protein
MISLSFTIMNPFSCSGESRDYFYRNWKLWGNKLAELQVTKWPANNLLGVLIDTRWFGHDHAGARVELELFGYYVGFTIYDCRHWNDEQGHWETHHAG